MMEAGRIQHHLKNNLADPNSAVLITGYCEPATLGGQLLNGAETVRIFGEEVAVKAEMLVMKEYSAHADYGDIAKFFALPGQRPIAEDFFGTRRETGNGTTKNRPGRVRLRQHRNSRFAIILYGLSSS